MNRIQVWVWGTLMGVSSVLCAGAHPAQSLIDDAWKKLSPVSEKSVERLCDEAHLLLWKAKYTAETDAKLEILEQMMERVELARQKAPKEPRPLLYWAAGKGEMAQVKSKFVAISYLKPLEAAALELKALAPTFRHCAADRILASLYYKAPGFISIGDKAKAKQHYQMMLQSCPDQPENELFYAEFLLDQDDFAQARQYAERALKSPKLKDFPIERYDWEQMGKEILAKVGDKTK